MHSAFELVHPPSMQWTNYRPMHHDDDVDVCFIDSVVRTETAYMQIC